MSVGRTSLDTLFCPRSIAVIGASNEPDRIGGRPLHLLKQGFTGALYPINPNRTQVQDLPAYASVEKVRGEVDLAIVAVPAKFVLPTITECGRKGVGSAIILSSGFAEEGPAGAEQQQKILDIARGHGMRVLGPNCMGVGNRPLNMWSTFSAGAGNDIRRGNISVVAQSGAFGSYVLSLMRRRDLGLNLWATTGNQSDVDFADCVAYFADDPATQVIFGYFEGISDGARLVTALERARQNGKPVVITKVGRSEAGAIAAASHTASLAGSDAIYEAVFRQYGVYRAETIEEALDIAYACSKVKASAGNRVGLVSISGGVGIMMTDAAVHYRLDPQSVPAGTQEKLREILPRSSVANPIDLTAQVQNDFSIIERCLDLLFADAHYDSVAIFLASLDLLPGLHENLVEMFKAFRERNKDKIIALVTNADQTGRRHYEDLGYLVFEEPARAIRALSALAAFAESFAFPPRVAHPVRAIQAVLMGGKDGSLDEQQAKALLKSAGITVPAETVVTSEDMAAAAADKAGYPVVLKIVSPDIVHKSDIGGVELSLKTADAVRAAYKRIMERVGKSAPNAKIEGVLVSPMIVGGTEMVLGIQNDPVFGPMVMAGLGGIFVEVLKDVSFRRAPVMPHEAREMLAELRGTALLHGVRGRPPADIEALVAAIVLLSRFAVQHADRIESIDINPILALPKGQGAIAVDAVVQLKAEPSCAGSRSP